MVTKIETVDAIVKAACVVHNFLRRRDGVPNDRRYIAWGEVDVDNDGRLVRGSWRQEFCLFVYWGLRARRLQSNSAPITSC